MSPLSSEWQSSSWQMSWSPSPSKSLASAPDEALPYPTGHGSRSKALLLSFFPGERWTEFPCQGKHPLPWGKSLLVNTGRQNMIEDAISRFRWLYPNQTVLQASHFGPLRGFLCNPGAIFSHLCKKLHFELPMDLSKYNIAFWCFSQNMQSTFPCSRF